MYTHISRRPQDIGHASKLSIVIFRPFAVPNTVRVCSSCLVRAVKVESTLPRSMRLAQGRGQGHRKVGD